MDIDEVTSHYIVAMLWSTTDESTPECGEPMDSNFAAKCRADCARFVERAGPLLVESNFVGKRSHDGSPFSLAAQVGHDFWLTRNGHGCGFWDGDWKSDRGAKQPLTKLAKSFGDVCPYVGDDGRIHG